MWSVKLLFKLDEEAEIQTNQLQNPPPSCARSGGTIKNRLAKTPNKLDEEAGTQAKSGQNISSWIVVNRWPSNFYIFFNMFATTSPGKPSKSTRRNALGKVHKKRRRL